MLTLEATQARPETAGKKRETEVSVFDLSEALHRIKHWLPTQGPIKDFIHHNTLHAFQDIPFHQGLLRAANLFGSKVYLDADFYLKAYEDKRITDEGLQKAIALIGESESERNELRERVARKDHFVSPRLSGLAENGVRGQWLKSQELDLNLLVHPILFKLLSGYLDQGISIWRMPHATDTFWRAVGRMVSESMLPFPPMSQKLSLFQLSAPEAIQDCLARIVGEPELYESYILEMLLGHPGWSGMVSMVEAKPSSLICRRDLTLQDVVAVELVLELGWLERRRGKDFPSIAAQKPASFVSVPDLARLKHNPDQKLQLVWHEAFEWTYYNSLLSALQVFNKDQKKSVEKPSVQAFFCIDDRECSVRRHLEEINSQIGTFATAGFFGGDFMFQGALDGYATQSCPVVLSPKHLVRETSVEGATPGAIRALPLIPIRPNTNTLFRGWLLAQTLGIWHSLRLAVQVFWPSANLPTEKSLSQVRAKTQLHLFRQGDEKSGDGLWLGYTIGEMVDRVFGVLRSTGLTSNFSDLVVLIGHGASSANNPHFAAYDCGACSGRPGAPNARAFAMMANNREVRAGVRAKGIEIPLSTHFVGALHDTTRDEMTYYDLETLPASHIRTFEVFRNNLESALERNAKERCRRFELVDPNLSPDAALIAVRRRSASIFEPRPELNHATNVAAIVGRRNITQGLFLDRRSFLNSYNPESDPEGEILTSILNAVVPVCGGISLEYYFSRVDPAVYGAGTKLPHNVVGLVGVANGVDGDLQTGLPTQMTEVHDPVRLIVLVEQEADVALKAIIRNPATYEWVKNDWVRYAALSPTTKHAYVYRGGQMQPFTGAPITLKSVQSSLEMVEGHTENIPIGIVRGGRP